MVLLKLKLNEWICVCQKEIHLCTYATVECRSWNRSLLWLNYFTYHDDDAIERRTKKWREKNGEQRIQKFHSKISSLMLCVLCKKSFVKCVQLCVTSIRLCGSVFKSFHLNAVRTRTCTHTVVKACNEWHTTAKQWQRFCFRKFLCVTIFNGMDCQLAVVSA